MCLPVVVDVSLNLDLLEKRYPQREEAGIIGVLKFYSRLTRVNAGFMPTGTARDELCSLR